MKFRTLSICAFATIAALAAQLPGDTSARVGKRNARRVATPRMAPGEFMVAGSYSGLLQGKVEISGREFRITDDTTIYFLGKGVVTEAPLLKGNSVHVMGRRERGSDVATFVFVREKSYGGRNPAPVVLDDDAPQ